MPDHSKTIGDRTEARVLAALLGRYETVCVPWGENQRFDLLVLDPADGWLRVQCKTGRLRGGAVRFATASFSYHHPNNRGTREYKHAYRGQADLFGVWCPETREVYLIPVEAVPVRLAALRVRPPRNGQIRGIRWAADFRIDPPVVDPPG